PWFDYFFFQAEDGIRDYKVTGVQTCALPIYSTFSKNRHGRFRDSDLLRRLFETVLQRSIAEGLVGGEGFAVDASMIEADANRQRSEERRVGKECRFRRWRYH